MGTLKMLIRPISWILIVGLFFSISHANKYMEDTPCSDQRCKEKFKTCKDLEKMIIYSRDALLVNYKQYKIAKKLISNFENLFNACKTYLFFHGSQKELIAHAILNLNKALKKYNDFDNELWQKAHKSYNKGVKINLYQRYIKMYENTARGQTAKVFLPTLIASKKEEDLQKLKIKQEEKLKEEKTRLDDLKKHPTVEKTLSFKMDYPNSPSIHQVNNIHHILKQKLLQVEKEAEKEAKKNAVFDKSLNLELKGYLTSNGAKILTNDGNYLNQFIFNPYEYLLNDIKEKAELNMYGKKWIRKESKLLPKGGVFIFIIYRLTIGQAQASNFTYVVKAGKKIIARGPVQGSEIPSVNYYAKKYRSDAYQNTFAFSLNKTVKPPYSVFLIDNVFKEKREWTIVN